MQRTCCKQYMKTSFLTFMLTSLLFACAKPTISQATVYPESVAEGPLDTYCQSNQHLEDWAEKMPHILIGTASAVVPKLPSMQMQNNSCWSKFTVQEWLKGSGPKEIWVMSRIHAFGRTYDDFKNLSYCEFKTGKTYIIFGRYTSASASGTPEYIGTATANGSDGFKGTCPPNTEVKETENNLTVKQIRSLIEKEK